MTLGIFSSTALGSSPDGIGEFQHEAMALGAPRGGMRGGGMAPGMRGGRGPGAGFRPAPRPGMIPGGRRPGVVPRQPGVAPQQWGKGGGGGKGKGKKPWPWPGGGGGAYFAPPSWFGGGYPWWGGYADYGYDTGYPLLVQSTADCKTLYDAGLITFDGYQRCLADPRQFASLQGLGMMKPGHSDPVRRDGSGGGGGTTGPFSRTLCATCDDGTHPCATRHGWLHADAARAARDWLWAYCSAHGGVTSMFDPNSRAMHGLGAGPGIIESLPMEASAGMGRVGEAAAGLGAVCLTCPPSTLKRGSYVCGGGQAYPGGPRLPNPTYQQLLGKCHPVRSMHGLGATDPGCNLTGKTELTRQLQARLGVPQTGYVDKATCAAFRDKQAFVWFGGKGFNIKNITDFLGVKTPACTNANSTVPDCNAILAGGGADSGGGGADSGGGGGADSGGGGTTPPVVQGGMSTGAKVGLGLLGLGLLGGIVYYASKPKRRGRRS